MTKGNGIALMALVGGAAAIMYAVRNYKSTPYDVLFEAKAREHNVPVALLKAVAMAESTMNANATNPKPTAADIGGGRGRYKDGSRDVGLMQVNTKTGARYGYSDAQLFQPAICIECAARYLAEVAGNLQRVGKLSSWTWPAAYNVGPDLEPVAIGEAYAAKVMYHQSLYEWGAFFS